MLIDRIGLMYEKLEQTSDLSRFGKVCPGTVRVGDQCTVYFENEIASSITVNLVSEGNHVQRSAWLYVEEGFYAVHFNTAGYKPGSYEVWLSEVGLPNRLTLPFDLLEPETV